MCVIVCLFVCLCQANRLSMIVVYCSIYISYVPLMRQTTIDIS